ncbi:MAG: hypothetical protein IJY47_01390 [Clostridia bacterium]|nr:hypothetical protein [Clostridia bacterium]
MSEERDQQQDFVSSETLYDEDTVPSKTEDAPLEKETELSEEKTDNKEEEIIRVSYTQMNTNEPFVAQPMPSIAREYNEDAFHRAEMTALIMGIIAIVLMGCCCVNIIFAIISICFAVKAKNLSQNKKMSSMALGGLICSIISIALTIIIIVLYVFIIAIVTIAEASETANYIRFLF